MTSDADNRSQPQREPYEPPILRVVATVEEATLGGVEISGDGGNFRS